jgi:hypothetical protein
MAGAAGVRSQPLLSIISVIITLGYRAALARLLEQSSPTGLIHALMDNEESLEKAAYASYRHANGFDKFVLASSPGGPSVKMDVWWPEDTRGQEDVHNHRYSFSSRLLTGELSIEHYELRDDGMPMNHFDIEIVSRRTDRLNDRGQERVEKRFEASIPAGTTYWLHHQQLHRVVAAPGVLSATLVCQDANARDTSDIFRPVGSARPERRYNAPFEPAELKDRLNRLLSELEHPRSG